MKDFRDYLERKNYRPGTIEGIERYAGRFLQWLEEENLTAGTLSYSDLLSFVRKLKSLDISIHTINCYLAGVQHYLEHQRKKGKILHNPAVNLRVKGKTESLPSDLLSRDQLQQIYDSYLPKTPMQKRNKVILGFIIYQGLIREELQSLEPTDLNLNKATIRIRKSVRLQSRTLKLAAEQILPIKEYLEKIRPELIELKGTNSGKLLISTGSSDHLKEVTRELIYHLRKKHTYFKNLLQLRCSLISHWAEEKNIREVQYMAGHNSIISTQRYTLANMDELKEQLGRFHPLS